MDLYSIIIILLMGTACSMLEIYLCWKKYVPRSPYSVMSGSSLELENLRSHAIFHRMWPTDTGFLSLHISILWRFVLGIVSLLIIWFFHRAWFSIALFALNILFALSQIPMQSIRSFDWQEDEEYSRDIFRNVRKACLVAFAYPFFVCICLIAGLVVAP